MIDPHAPWCRRENAAKLKIALDVEGATREELDRGSAAAQAVFDNAGVLSCDAFAAVFKCNWLDDDPSIEGDLTDEEHILRDKEIDSQIAFDYGLVSGIMRPDEQTAYVAGLAAAVKDVTKGSIAGLKSALSASDGRMDLSRIPLSLRR